MPTPLDKVIIELRLETSQLKRELSKVQREVSKFTRKVSGSAKQSRTNFEQLASSIFTVRNVLAALSAIGVFQGARGLIKSSAEFETNLVAIGKTANISGRILQNLGKLIQGIAQELPIATNELLRIGVAAGQIGVKGNENIAKFVETLGKLQLATDILGEEGAKNVARILTLTSKSAGEGFKNVDRFGSALVDLGNSAAATEGEILEVATKVAQATAVFKVGPQFVLGLSTAMREMGISAEIAGTQVGLAFQALNKALFTTSKTTKIVLNLLQKDLKELQILFRIDAEGVFELFLKSLSELDRTQVPQVLAEMELTGARMFRVLGPLSQRFELVAGRIKQANREFEKNTALTIEAARVSATFAGRMQIVGNRIREVAKAIGDEITPVITRLLVPASKKLTENIEGSTDAFFALAAGATAFIATQLPFFIIDAVQAFRRLFGAGDKTTRSIKGVLSASIKLRGLTGIITRFASSWVGLGLIIAGIVSTLVGFGRKNITIQQETKTQAEITVTGWQLVKAAISAATDELKKFEEKAIKIRIPLPPDIEVTKFDKRGLIFSTFSSKQRSTSLEELSKKIKALSKDVKDFFKSLIIGPGMEEGLKLFIEGFPETVPGKAIIAKLPKQPTIIKQPEQIDPFKQLNKSSSEAAKRFIVISKLINSFEKGMNELEIATLKTSGAFDNFAPGAVDFLVSLGLGAEDLKNAMNLLPSAIQLAEEQLEKFTIDLSFAEKALKLLNAEDDPAGFKIKEAQIETLRAQVAAFTNDLKRLNEEVPTFQEFMEQFAQVQTNKKIAEIRKESNLLANTLDILGGGFARTVDEAEQMAQVLQDMGKSLEDLDPKLLAEIKEFIKLQRAITKVEDAASLFADTMRTLKDISTDLDTEIKILRGDTEGYSAELLRLAASLGLVGDEFKNVKEQMEELDKKFKELKGLEEFRENLNKFRSVFENTFDDMIDSALKGKFDIVDIFTSMVNEIQKEILRLLVVKPIMDKLFGDRREEGDVGIIGKKFLGKKAQPVKVLGVADVRVIEKINVEGLQEGTEKLLKQGDVSNNFLAKLIAIMAGFGGGGGGGSKLGSIFGVISTALGFFGGGRQAAADAAATGAFMDPSTFGKSASNIPSVENLSQKSRTGAIKSGGDTFITIDARNSIGEEALVVSVEDALARALPNVVNAATNNIIIRRRRDPRIFEN